MKRRRRTAIDLCRSTVDNDAKFQTIVRVPTVEPITVLPHTQFTSLFLPSAYAD
jgi:hypothetical protein